MHASFPPGSETETLEVVDRNNRLLGCMPRNQVHRQQLMHRAVLVMIFDANNRLVLQRRSGKKSLYPRMWDLSATGHVMPGESREEAAMRELGEELGVAVKRLSLRCHIPASAATGHEFVTLYSAGRITAPLFPNPEEIEDLYSVDRDELEGMLLHVPDMLTPGLTYFGQRKLIFAPE